MRSHSRKQSFAEYCKVWDKLLLFLTTILLWYLSLIETVFKELRFRIGYSHSRLWSFSLHLNQEEGPLRRLSGLGHLLHKPSNLSGNQNLHKVEGEKQLGRIVR